ncbi:putative bifunctional diguanylate cyclase/phosphodiesterase [Actinoplanes awajinensis]|uniref:Diguanylate cyclase n=1 Tax=Actinoplanes awajinensis subsp. mycoplanecinus TaxID=135947 RepID=A0A117MNU5_9ACTN|nr:EAL domain-containing protein [Actinoplanes awajinensis]KUL27672.1 diguanylate cyclase [Actinoplanes awajinensis subsp. mycoplanecinus]
MGTWLTWLRDRLPAGGGLRDEDWAARHRLLTLLLAVVVVGVTVFGALRPDQGSTLLWTDLLVLPCVVAGTLVRHRRLQSVCVAIGFTVACGGFVSLSNGLTEAHFSFFIAVAALALYRDWAPFGAFLVATTLHHAVFGVLVSSHTYDHHQAMSHPLVWAVLHGVAVLLAAGFQVVAWGLTESEERRAQDNLEESQAQLSVAFDETPVPMVMFAPDGRVLRTNAAYRHWLRLPDQLPADFSVRDVPLVAVNDEMKAFDRAVASRDPITMTRQYRRTDDGTLIWVELHSTPLYDKQGKLRFIFAHCMDITSARNHQEELRRQVRHDTLTGLLSRKAFENDLAGMLARKEPVSVIYLDVDRFKSVNDGSGHAAGDDVLRALSARLARTVPSGALLARLGGDEFVVALAGPPADGLRTGQEILASMGQPLDVSGNQLPITVSIGVASVYGAEHTDDVVLAADTAMYAAKRAGGNRLEVFAEGMRASVHERIAAEARLRQALAGNLPWTLPLWFQPVVSTVTGQIVGAEALCRMRTPDGRILSPYHFIGAAEETGMIVPLGEHVLRSAVDHLLYWSGHLGYVSVNVSPRQLAEPDFVPKLADLLASHPGLDPARLVLEITETALLASTVDVSERLATIKRLGVRIALDDFGTGYSSLTWLKSVPADIVKLDRSFVAGLAEDQRKASIISAVLWLARSLGMSTIAEGVEETADWEALKAAGCPAVQGFFFSPPKPPEEFQEMLLSGACVTPMEQFT